MNKQDKSKINKNPKKSPHTYNKIKQKIDYCIAGSGLEADKVVSAETTQKIYSEYSNVLTEIGCFKGTACQRW